HCYHDRIIEYDNRPFKNVEEMHEKIIENHNAVVDKGDHFYYLGDLSLRGKKYEKELEAFLKQLNGQKFFIKGNNDDDATKRIYKRCGVYYGEQKSIKVHSPEGGDRIQIILNHFPLRTWDQSHRGSYHTHGHEHGNLNH